MHLSAGTHTQRDVFVSWPHWSCSTCLPFWLCYYLARPTLLAEVMRGEQGDAIGLAQKRRRDGEEPFIAYYSHPERIIAHDGVMKVL